LRLYKTDLHLHSVLSPCGDLEMSPKAVMKKASEMGIEIIAVTDHNSMANSCVYQRSAVQFGIHYIYGVEIQTAEEIHVIALFDNWEIARKFNKELFNSLLPIKNDPEYFGDQIVIDDEENIVRIINKALLNSSIWTFETVLKKIEAYGGFGFPAHVDAYTNSVISQLGFIPQNSKIIAVGITAHCDVEGLLKKYPYLKDYALIRNSDAHYLADIGSGTTDFYLEEPSLSEIILACKNEKKRKIKYNWRSDGK